MHPLVGALQPKNVPSLERQALSLQLLLHQPPCDAPASCVDAKGFASYKKLKSSVLGLFCSVFVCSYIHLVQSFSYTPYIYTLYSRYRLTRQLALLTAFHINWNQFLFNSFPNYPFHFFLLVGNYRNCLSVSTVD